MDFAVLGPIVVRRDGRELPLGGPKQRALLAILLLRANEVVSRDGLIDGLWGERPPPTAAHTLDNYVSRLRKTLGDGRLSRRAPGYVLHVERDELDLDRFERLLGDGRGHLAVNQATEAAETLRAALALWRGPALADLLYEPFAQGEAERLEERRLVALENRIDADLALGGGSELVTELEALVRDSPQQERLLAQLMLALYRAGRQAEALAAFQRARRRLAEELGLEPGPELRELERKMIMHDPSLGVPRAGSGTTRERRLTRRGLVGIAVAAAAVIASVTVGIVLGTHGTSASSVAAGSDQLVSLRLGSGTLADHVEVAGAPSTMVAGHGSLWLASPSTGAVLRVDPAAGSVVDRIPVGGTPGALAVGGGSVWAASVPGDRVVQIDPKTGTISQTIRLAGSRASALAFAAGRLWIGDIVGNRLIEVDPLSGSVLRRLSLDFRPTTLAGGTGKIWAADYVAGSVAEVDIRSGQTVATTRAGNGPSAIALGRKAVWVTNALDSTVSRIDPASGSVVATIPVGSGPTAVATTGRSVWVANQYSKTVSRIDPDRNAVAQTITLGVGPTALDSAAGRMWIGVQPLAPHRGGTLVLLHQRPISIDPALHVDLLPLVSDALTRDGLLTYNHVPGPAGIRLVPDLAVSVPLPSDGGRTYTFRLRPHIRYSDGRPLRAGDFRRAIERVFRLGSEGEALFKGIRGAGSCNPAYCDLSRGIATDESTRTVSFHLRAPDPDFLRNLTEHGLATAVPAGTPFHDTGLKPIPGTGPYKIARASEREIRYVRNPLFREWSHAARPEGNPDAIVLSFGLSPAQEVRAIEEGRADWMADNIPARLVPALARRLGSQLHSAPIPPTTDFLQLNTTLPPFDDVRVRRALNFAIDRRAIVRIYGGPKVASATCQPLPEGLPGFHRYCPYTLRPSPEGTWKAPEFARARRLVAASGTRGTPVTVWGWTDDPTISPRVVRYAAAVLRRLGYPTRVRLASHSFLPVPLSKIQLIPGAWGDTTDGFLTTLFSCAGAGNHGWFCDYRVDRAIARARALRASRPRLAASLWARIDHRLVDEAAWVPLIDEHAIDFVSARVRNYQSHPYWGVIADQLWLR